MQGRFPRFRRHIIRPVDFFLRTTHQTPQQTFSRSFRLLCRLLRFCPTLFFLHMSRRFLGLLLSSLTFSFSCFRFGGLARSPFFRRRFFPFPLYS